VTRLAVLAAACAACAASRPPIVAVVSADAEWRAVVAHVDGRRRADTPFGEWLVHRFPNGEVIFFHGGYGKVAAAASTQYAIARWRPRLIVNLGTCGGFGGARAVGDVVLADRTIIYDLVEQMGDPDEPIRDYTTALDASLWPARLRNRVVVGTIVSGDRDLVPAELATLSAKYRASVGDWESGAFAWTARRNGARSLVLREVTDIVDAGGDATYGDAAAWQRRADVAMAHLIELLASAIGEL
jgi:adenosylhomocysteine nucleosidase